MIFVQLSHGLQEVQITPFVPYFHSIIGHRAFEMYICEIISTNQKN